MKHTTVQPAQAFEPEFIESLRQLFEEQIVFNRVMGLKVA